MATGKKARGRFGGGYSKLKNVASAIPQKMAGERGFTLFTALVAFILIVLSLLLVQSMVSTERSVSDIISDISDQEEMQAIADLARADALQVFNFGIRYTIEDFSTKDADPKDGLPENDYKIFEGDSRAWGDWKKKFVMDRFGVGTTNSNQFALLAARHLISLLERTDDARGFNIDLVNPDEATMAAILKENFSSQSESGGNEFLQVIGCEPENGGSGEIDYEKCVGSFYVTMDLAEGKMADEDYEKFPQVKVQNRQTGRVLKEPILPRGKFRIYVPIRLFKALAGAREIAYSSGQGVFDDESFIGSVASAGSRLEAKGIVENKVNGLVQSSHLLKTSSNDFGVKQFDVIVTTNGAGSEEGPDKIISFEVRLYFEETNDKYRVSTKQPSIYGVTLVKMFV